MPEFVLKYADTRGEIHEAAAEAPSERELRDKYTQQGFLVYSCKPKSELSAISKSLGVRKKQINYEKFLIFNQNAHCVGGSPAAENVSVLTGMSPSDAATTTLTASPSPLIWSPGFVTTGGVLTSATVIVIVSESASGGTPSSVTTTANV